MRRYIVVVLIVGMFICGCTGKKDEGFAKEYINSIGIEFVLIPSGSFEMGDEDADEKPIHTVTISKSFYMGKYEITQEQWEMVTASNPSKFQGAKRPVENISLYDAKIFLSKLNAMENTDKYRLPTEAEWEYAARSTTRGKYSFGDDENELEHYGWYHKRYDKKIAKDMLQTHIVGTKKPNGWGLYDIHGNVWEWTDDWYDPQYYSKSPKIDPKNNVANGTIVIRGGSWINSPKFLRSAARNHLKAAYKGDDVGLRVVMEIK